MSNSVSNSVGEVQRQIDQLRQDYLDHLADKLQEIEDCWRQVSTGWEQEVAETFYCLVHTLTGSSATFGLTALSQTVRTLEHLIQRCLTDGTLSLSEDLITALLQMLKQQVEIECVNPHLPIERVLQPFAPSYPASRANQRLVYLVDANPDLAQDLALQIGYFGYRVSILQREMLSEAIGLQAPAVVILNSNLPGDDRAAAKIIADLKQHCYTIQAGGLHQPCPVIFLSTKDEFVSRLQAVRAGGDAYFTKPVNVNELVDKLDALVGNSQPDPYRILIVEDDRAVAEFHALTLQHAGMTTQVVSDPLTVMQPLSEFKPDLILMDVYMPSCSGLELATVIRQQPAYVSIPIVFLSTETDLYKQLAAMSLGGDDFLTKPIQPEHLISSVASRANRSATLRSLMVRDSLTGLYNHTKLKEQLAIELKRAARQNTRLAFAMIDIDHFKRVNDTYGHPVGDRVIKSLSRLLKQRLRQTDIVGRYGGEEFAMIFVDTDVIAAVKVMNEIRQSFAQVQQQAAMTEFNVTFSCGIAAFPAYVDVTQLSNAADRALYQAKRNGRNQVVLAEN